MMYLRSNTSRTICSIALLVLLVVPASLQLMHHFEHQNHVVCKFQGELHFHQTDMDCELCDFQFSPTTFTLFKAIDLNPTPTRQHQETLYNFLSCSSQKTAKQLRAPPVTS